MRVKHKYNKKPDLPTRSNVEEIILAPRITESPQREATNSSGPS